MFGRTRIIKRQDLLRATKGQKAVESQDHSRPKSIRHKGKEELLLQMEVLDYVMVISTGNGY